MTNYVIFAFIGVVALIAFFALSRYLRLLDNIRENTEAGSGKNTDAVRAKTAEKVREAFEAETMSEKARSALNALCRNGLTKDMEIVFDEMARKIKTVTEQKDIKFKEVNEKYNKTLGEKKQTESVIRSIAEGLVVLNNRNEVIMMNPAAEKLLDVRMAGQIGKPIHSMVKDRHLMSLASDKGSPGETEIELNSVSENTKKVLRSSSAVIENENGRTVGMVSVFTDVTKQREVDALKSQFVSSVSHELRTPLVAIRNSIAIIFNPKAGSLTAEQAKYLSIAEKNLKRLSRLIDDLLDISKMDAGKMDLRLAPASIEKLIDETCATLDAWAQTKDIEIVRNVRGNIPEIKMDPERIAQILTNLIGNSIKFTPAKGAITVEACVKEEGGKNMLLVRVIDSGPGISKEDMPKLFNKFQQAGGDRRSEDISGTGLGLYISKELVELHGGSVWAESARDQGAIFAFTLPIT